MFWYCRNDEKAGYVTPVSCDVMRYGVVRYNVMCAPNKRREPPLSHSPLFPNKL